MDASRDGTADAAGGVAGVRVLRRDPGRLVPQLWLDGILATDAPLVALSTAAMVPAPGWLDAMFSTLEATGAAGVGGPIEPAEALGPFERAVYLHRYGRYHRPFGSQIPEPPGDNALYRREAIAALNLASDEGFWEVEAHRSFHRTGRTLAMAAEGVVHYQGRTRASGFLAQRFRHGARFGSQRSVHRTRAGRWVRLATSPAVPALLTGRALKGVLARGAPVGPWLSATPWLALLGGVWAAGEAFGMCFGNVNPRARRREALQIEGVT
ncbi:MAG: glycosyltransferase [Isosphaeraceae bacterium]